jgi:hypothetical protein
MQAGFGHDIHPAPEEVFEVLYQPHLIEEAPAPLKIHEKIHITPFGIFIPLHRSKHADISCTIS